MQEITIIVLAICLAGGFAQKPGACPPALGAGICANLCNNDTSCRGAMKCCRTACGGTACSVPVTARNPKLLAAKPGYCPARPSGPWVCSSRCAYDSDCRGKLKCCRNRCGATACTKPEVL